MNEFLEQFLIESRELVEQATTDLLTLEHDPANRPVLDSAFRAFHTLKGAAGIMDFTAMARVTHAAEDLLAAVRAGDRVLTADVVSQCLSCIDQIVAWLGQIEAEDALPEDADRSAEHLTERLTGAVAPLGTIAADPDPAPAWPIALPDDAIALLKEQVALISVPPDDGFFGRLGAAGRVCRNVLRQFGYLEEVGDLETALAVFKAALLTAPAAAPGLDATSAPSVAPAAAPPADAAGEPESQSATARSLRVDVGRIEEIVKITGELIVAKNALDHLVRSMDDPKTLAQLQPLNGRFNRLTEQLLSAVLATRVLPLHRVFQRFPRLVREMAAQLQKPIRLVTEGDTTEADKVIVEALFEPILHVLRNAIDHGVESAAARKAAGKPETAIITLRGRRDGDQVMIEIEDDGAGIDLAAVRDTAIRRGLITPDAALLLPDAEILELIFLPGFSTASVLTDISGRGVGMDAVRAGVERLGGRVALRSVAAKGTSVSFVLPFTIMMTRVLTLHAGGQVFGVPFDEVVETVQLPIERVVPVGSAEAIVLHDRTIPLIRLASALELPETQNPVPHINAAVVRSGGELGALQVDGFGGQLDIILKPMEGLLAGMHGIAGSSLLGDGRVLIVLEVQDLLR